MSQSSFIPSRREFLTICGGVGVVSSFFVGALYALAAASPSEPISAEIIDQAAELAGITILPEQNRTKARRDKRDRWDLNPRSSGLPVVFGVGARCPILAFLTRTIP